MDNKKYIGMDVHQATISAAVRDASGKLVMESIVETKAATILEFIQGIHGSLWVTFEEGTGAAWLYDLLHPQLFPVPPGPRNSASSRLLMKAPMARSKTRLRLRLRGQAHRPMELSRALPFVRIR